MLPLVPHSNTKDLMRTVLGRRAAPTLTRLAVAGVVAVSALATAQSASALSFAYYNAGLAATTQAAGQSVGGYTATYNGADSPSHKIQAAAHYEGGWSLHGSYVDGWVSTVSPSADLRPAAVGSRPSRRLPGRLRHRFACRLRPCSVVDRNPQA